MHTCYDCYQGNENVSRVWLAHDFSFAMCSLSITNGVKKVACEKIVLLPLRLDECRFFLVWFCFALIWFDLICSWVVSSSSYSSIFNFRYSNSRSIWSSLEFSLSRSTSSALSHSFSLFPPHCFTRQIERTLFQSITIWSLQNQQQ